MERYQRVRDLREDRDLTQTQVGAALDVPQQTYAYYESGQCMILPHVLCALADFNNVSGDCLLGRINKRKYVHDKAVRSIPYRFAILLSNITENASLCSAHRQR